MNTSSDGQGKGSDHEGLQLTLYGKAESSFEHDSMTGFLPSNTKQAKRVILSISDLPLYVYFI